MLKSKRGISFEDVITSIAGDGLLMDIAHPNKDEFPNQRMFGVNIGKDAYSVPYEQRKEIIHLITVFPNRKFKFLLRGSDEK